MKRETKTVQSIQIRVDSISFYKNIIHKYTFKKGLKRFPVLNYLLLHKSSRPINKIKNSIKISKYKNMNLFIENRSYKKKKNNILNQDINHKKQFDFIKLNKTHMQIINPLTLTPQSNNFYSQNTQIQKQFNFIKLNNFTFQTLNRLNLSSPSNNFYYQNNNLKREFKKNNEISYQKKIDFIKLNNTESKRVNSSISSLLENNFYYQNSTTKKHFKWNNKINSSTFQMLSPLSRSLKSNNFYLQNSKTQNDILNEEIHYQKKIDFIKLNKTIQKTSYPISQLNTLFLKTKHINRIENSYKNRLYIKTKNRYSNAVTQQKHVSKESIIVYAPNQNRTFQQQKESTHRPIETKNIDANNKEQIISHTEKAIEHFHHYEIKKLADKIYPMIMKKWQKEFEKRGVFHA